MFSDLTRRDFFKKAGVLASALALSGCGSERAEERLVPFLDAPEEQVAGVFTYYASTCQECPAGCGILVKLMGGRARKIEGNPRHPVNQGRLCAMGQSSLQALYNPDRVPGPRNRPNGKGGAFASTTWDDGVAALAQAIGEAGEGGLAVVGGHLPDHLYRLTALLLEAVGGHAPQPIVWDAARATQGENLLLDVMEATFGERRMPAFAIGSADVVVSFGAGLLEQWLSPVAYAREYAAFRQGPGGRGLLVQVEPRFSATAACSDRWVACPPGREGEVALVLGRVILDEGLAATGRPAGVDAVFRGVQPRELADSMGLSFDVLVQVARQLGSARAPLALPGGALGGYENGSAGMGVVMALNLLVGAPGNTLGLAPALEQDALAPLTAVSTFADVRDLVTAMDGGRIKVLLVLDGDPLHDLPAALGFEQAAAKVPLVVDFSPFPTDTQVALADLALPAPTGLESWGYSVPQVGMPVAVVGSQQPTVTPLHDTRAPADVLLAVAKELGGKAAASLPWGNEVEYLRATVGALSGVEGGSIASPDEAVFIERFQQFGGWWLTSAAAAGAPGATPAGEMPAARVPDTADPRERPPIGGDAQARPYVLQIFPHQLLGGGRGANRPWLQEVADTMTSIGWWSWAELSPEAAAEFDVVTGDLVKVTSSAGSVEVPVYVYPGAAPGTVAMPLGQGHRAYGRYAEDRGINPLDLLVLAEVADSGELAWGATRVSIEKVAGHRRLATLEGSPSRMLPQGL